METLKESLMRMEGLSLKPYRDSVGLLTLGYGRCLAKRGITQVEAEFLLDNDIAAVKEQYEDLPGWVKSKCNGARKEVILNMIFQLGFAGVLLFKRMLKAIMVGDYSKAAEEIIDSKACKQCPNRFHEHASRMRSGT